MALPTGVIYETFVCPAVRHTSPHSFVHLRELVKKEIQESVIGEPVVISSYLHRPHWYLFIVFEELRRLCSEVAIEVLEEKKLLLSSLLPRQDFLHTEEVIILPELISEPDIVPDVRTPELEFDLSEVSPAQDENFIDTILYVKQRVKYVKNLVLTGQNDPFTSLLCYVVWLKYTQSIVYKEEEQVLKLV